MSGQPGSDSIAVIGAESAHLRGFDPRQARSVDTTPEVRRATALASWPGTWLRDDGARTTKGPPVLPGQPIGQQAGGAPLDHGGRDHRRDGADGWPDHRPGGREPLSHQSLPSQASSSTELTRGKDGRRSIRGAHPLRPSVAGDGPVPCGAPARGVTCRTRTAMRFRPRTGRGHRRVPGRSCRPRSRPCRC
jgi:hypothetical protein